MAVASERTDAAVAGRALAYVQPVHADQHGRSDPELDREVAGIPLWKHMRDVLDGRSTVDELRARLFELASR